MAKLTICKCESLTKWCATFGTCNFWDQWNTICIKSLKQKNKNPRNLGCNSLKFRVVPSSLLTEALLYLGPGSLERIQQDGDWDTAIADSASAHVTHLVTHLQDTDRSSFRTRPGAGPEPPLSRGQVCCGDVKFQLIIATVYTTC